MCGRLQSMGAVADEISAASQIQANGLRLQGEVETTGTLKYRKVDLVDEGFDPSKTTDPLYVFDLDKGAYAPIDTPMFAKIVSGVYRL